MTVQRKTKRSEGSTDAKRDGVVRLDRVAEARRRVESGWYDRSEVRDRLVEQVLEEVSEA
jgi:hypothetical protein